MNSDGYMTGIMLLNLLVLWTEDQNSSMVTSDAPIIGSVIGIGPIIQFLGNISTGNDCTDKFY